MQSFWRSQRRVWYHRALKAMLISDGTNTGNDYAYDLNGNLTSDANKDITNITYNHLNIPTSIIFNGSSSQKIEYFLMPMALNWRSVWIMEEVLRKPCMRAILCTVGAVLIFISTRKVMWKRDNGSYKYYYQYKDHLGNIRVSNVFLFRKPN